MPAPKSRPTGPEPPPAVQQLLVRYAKRGRMRFASIRDGQRPFERAVPRAGLPIAHSAGFSPHPKISYASGTQTGVSSEAEYLTLALTAPVDSAGMRSVLDRALPDGIDVIEVVEDFGGSLNGRLMVSEWLVELPGVAPDAAEAAARTFLAASEVPVERLTNKGIRRFDARAAVLTLAVSPRAGTTDHHEWATIRMVVRHTEPAVRPEDVLNGMLPGGAASVKPAVAVTRVAQGILGPEGGASAVVAPTPAKVNVP